MRILRRIRLILARPFFFMADRFTDGVSHYTSLGDWFYHAGMAVVNHQFSPLLLIIKTVCPNCKDEQRRFQMGFPVTDAFMTIGLNESYITCSKCEHKPLHLCIIAKVKDETIPSITKDKHPIGSYRWMYRDNRQQRY